MFVCLFNGFYRLFNMHEMPMKYFRMYERHNRIVQKTVFRSAFLYHSVA